MTTPAMDPLSERVTTLLHEFRDAHNDCRIISGASACAECDRLPSHSCLDCGRESCCLHANHADPPPDVDPLADLLETAALYLDHPDVRRLAFALPSSAVAARLRVVARELRENS